MRISELSTSELRRMLTATRETLGDNAVEARILRRELSRRDEQRAVLDRTGEQTGSHRLGGSER